MNRTEEMRGSCFEPRHQVYVDMLTLVEMYWKKFLNFYCRLRPVVYCEIGCTCSTYFRRMLASKKHKIVSKTFTNLLPTYSEERRRMFE